MGERKILVMSNIPIHFAFNLNIQNCIEITESKKCHRASKSNHSSPASIRSFQTGSISLCKEEKKGKTEKEVISFKFILFLLWWGAQWTAAGHHCYQQWVNITKDSHCLNIIIFRTAKASRKLQQRL